MSEFGNYLAQQIELQQTTGTEMALRLGVSRPHFSNFLNGHITSCNVDTLMSMAAGISDDPAVQSGLLQAYFRDQCVEKYRPWVHVSPIALDGDTRGGRAAEDAPRYGHRAGGDVVDDLARSLHTLRLPTDLVRSLGAIALACRDFPKFRTVIHDLGKFAREELPLPGHDGDGHADGEPDRAKPEVTGKTASTRDPRAPAPGKVRYQPTPQGRVAGRKPAKPSDRKD